MSFRAIKPTKTNLMNLQKRLNFAIKGEKFLELKREQLMDQIKNHWRNYIVSRDIFYQLYRESLIKLHESYKEMGKRDLVLISEMSRIQYKPMVNIRHVKKLGMTTAEINLDLDITTKLPAYSFENSSHFLDTLILKGRKFFESLIKFAEQEDILIKYALNLKKINRRINGLKNNIIPSLKLDIKLIREMIEEIDRENFVRLKKTKDLIKKRKSRLGDKMARKNEMSMFDVVINSNYKDRLLNQLSILNNVHIKTKKGSQMKKKIKEKDPLMNIIKTLRANLNNLLKKLNINESDLQELKVKKNQRLKFVASDLNDLINQIYEEINFYLNRINELERYSSKAQIELENLKIIKSSYVFLEQYQLNRESLSNLKQFDFKVFTTFSKNMENIESLLNFSAFPNVHQTDENSPNIYQLEDRSVFFIFYPRDQEDELKERINIIHAEEVPILKKYLTIEGINFTRIINEINIINNTIIKYLKEKKKIRNQNLAKFSAINEVVQNIEEYNWAEHQFEEVSADRSRIKFYIPTKNVKKVRNTLIENLKDKIHIEFFDVPKYHPTHEEGDEQVNQLDMKSKAEFETKKSNLKEPKQPDSREAAPTVMKNPFFIRPFESLTKMYGVPSYSEIDPTPFLALTFPLLFGLMFGDIGHGMSLIIAGIFGGILFRKKKGMRDISWVIFYCGIGALFCGFLYGEFFGSNEILGYELQVVQIPVPLLGIITLNNPLDNIMSVFKFTLFVGVIHVNIGWFIQFMNYWKQSKKYLSVTDSFMKMCLVTGGTILIFTYGINLDDWLSYPYPILLVLVPGILLIVLKPIGGILGISYLKKESIGTLLGEGSIETFETALSILSNIASYIRLLALALAHIALMIAIEALIDLIPAAETITPGMDFLAITGIILLEGLRLFGIILGNAFVILLEGILVFINTLRLHFYEFFFKFYQGSGTEFFPFYLDDTYSLIQFWVDYEKDLISEEIDKEIDTKKVKEDLKEAIQIINDKFFYSK